MRTSRHLTIHLARRSSAPRLWLGVADGVLPLLAAHPGGSNARADDDERDERPHADPPKLARRDLLRNDLFYLEVTPSTGGIRGGEQSAAGAAAAQMIALHRHATHQAPVKAVATTRTAVITSDTLTETSHPTVVPESSRYVNVVRIAARHVRVHASRVRSLAKSVDIRESRSRPSSWLLTTSGRCALGALRLLLLLASSIIGSDAGATTLLLIGSRLGGWTSSGVSIVPAIVGGVGCSMAIAGGGATASTAASTVRCNTRAVPSGILALSGMTMPDRSVLNVRKKPLSASDTRDATAARSAEGSTFSKIATSIGDIARSAKEMRRLRCAGGEPTCMILIVRSAAHDLRPRSRKTVPNLYSLTHRTLQAPTVVKA